MQVNYRAIIDFFNCSDCVGHAMWMIFYCEDVVQEETMRMLKNLSITMMCAAVAAFADGVDYSNRERYEWAQFWWNDAHDSSKPRVLIVGDSITNGCADRVYKLLADVALVDKYVSSKNVKDPALRKEMRYMLSEYKYKVIHFNHGLHGLRIKEDEYEGYLRSYVTEIKDLAGDAKLVWGRITPLRGAIDTKENALLERRNRVADKVMAEFGIEIDDLWGVVWNQQNSDDIRADNKGDAYHYNGKGYDLLAKSIADSIRKAGGFEAKK